MNIAETLSVIVNTITVMNNVKVHKCEPDEDDIRCRYCGREL